MGGIAILADTEISRDRHYTQRLGVDLTKLQYLEFARDSLYLENVMQAIYSSIDFWGDHYPDIPVIIGLDALGGTATREELEKGLVPDRKRGKKNADGEDCKEKSVQPGLAARVMHQAARLLPGRLMGRKIGLVILNHEYEMIGGFGGGFGAKKKETYGGSGIRHVGTTRIQLYSSGVWIKRSDGVALGREVTAKLIKNRLGDSQIEITVPILSGIGVENIYTLFEELKAAKVIVVAGSWAALNIDGQELKFQGWSGLKLKCTEDGTLFDRLVSVWKQSKGN
jgi:RecA/RadA recombinase